ncbi:MAG: hypothetical protein ACJ8FS_09235 [Sphingomicrobium sp.]
MSDYLRLGFSDLELHEVLQKPVSILLGVDEAAVQALETIGVKSVFDLGSSGVFAQSSAAITAAASAVGPVPSDLLKADVQIVSLDDIPSLPLASLRGISVPQATAMGAAFDVETIRDFAFWPPRQTAQRLVREAAGSAVEDEANSLADKLRPAMGEYPTERVYYDKLVMLGSAAANGLTPLALPLDLTAGADGTGSNALAVGALTTFSQSWFAQGITLGQMLHSLALAPGEATRIAVVDWKRRTAATATESIDESEQVISDTSHNRAISEVQNSVADEMQRGGSSSRGWAKSESSGNNMSGALSGGIAGSYGSLVGAVGLSGGASYTHEKAKTSFGASSSSWSIGNRSVMAEMAQTVNDRTEQHASSVRSRRASSVREVSQSEHEQISTRVVANYNHMHALTVQYYEVVQLYRVIVRLHTAERVLFLPFQIIDFSGADGLDLVARWRDVLASAALTPRIAALVADPIGLVEIRSGVPFDVPVHVGDLANAGVSGAFSARMMEGAAVGSPQPTVVHPDPPPSPPPAPTIRLVSVVGRGPLVDAVTGNARLDRISFEGISIERLKLEQADVSNPDTLDVASSANGSVAPSSETFLRTLTGIYAGTASGLESSGTMTLHCSLEGRDTSIPVPITLKASTGFQRVAFVDGDAVDRKAELLSHLQANRAYYTRAVLEELDPGTLTSLLAGFSWQDRPLVDQVEPVPVAVAGNYIVLRAPAEPDAESGIEGSSLKWQELLAEKGIDQKTEDVRLIPIPSGGVFAEAVLGRSNCAEKLDITRFWNWQDSPIPLQPPEISPVMAGSRATDENLVPGQLGSPILNIMNPTSLPDPSGLGAILGAVANGNMFRDMSGLAGTQEMARAASAGTLTAATEAGRIASDNYRIATENATEMGKTAADMWKFSKGSERNSGSSGSDRSVSAEGARINHGRDMDERGIRRPSQPANGNSSVNGGSARGQPSAVNNSIPNELVRSDSGAGFSPALIGETVRETAPSTDFMTSVNEAFGLDATSARADLLTPEEKSAIKTIEADLVAAKLTLAGAMIRPMRLHPKAAVFKGYFGAWTDSSKEVYLDLDSFIEADDEKDARVVAIRIMRHEREHVLQFKANNDPKYVPTYVEMALYESFAYLDDMVWSAFAKDFFEKRIGLSAADAGTRAADFFDTSKDEAAKVNVILQQIPTFTAAQREDSTRDAMLAQDLLPTGFIGKPARDFYIR